MGTNLSGSWWSKEGLCGQHARVICMPAFQATALPHTSCGTAAHTPPGGHPSNTWLLHQEDVKHGHLGHCLQGNALKGEGGAERALCRPIAWS